MTAHPRSLRSRLDRLDTAVANRRAWALCRRIAADEGFDPDELWDEMWRAQHDIDADPDRCRAELADLAPFVADIRAKYGLDPWPGGRR